MATVTTSTIADLLAPPGNSGITRQYVDSSTNYYYAAVRTATDTLTIYRSTDSGGSWGSYAAFTHTGLQEWSSLVFESAGYVHLAYRVGTGTTDSIQYRRLNVTTASFSSALQIADDANGGSIGSRWTGGVDIAPIRNSDSSYCIAVAAAYADATPRHGVYVLGVSIAKNAGSITKNNGLISGTRFWGKATSSPGRSGVTCETEHNGDGYTSTSPSVWITWGRNALNVVRLGWQGSSVGWQGPTGFTTIRSTLPTNQDYAAGRWDGTQFLMAVPNPDDTTKVRVYQRNKSNTLTQTFDSPVHTTGVVRNCAVTYDFTTKNIRVYAMGTSTNVLYYVDYVRATQTWSAWATVVAAAVSSSGTEWTSRRGGSAGPGRYDVLTTSGASSPYTVTHTSQTTTTVPLIATFITSDKAYNNNGPANVGAALPLTWTFTSAAGFAQGSYALSRQIGAGALAYWRASDSTWQAGEVQNASATQGVTLASGWALDADANYQYRVKVWDSAGTVAAGYSPALTLIPSAQVNPSISAPAAAAVLTADTVTVTWTAAQQTGARIVLAQTSPSAVTVYDSGAMMGYTDTSFTVPTKMATATGWTVTLYTYNNEGLASAAQSRNFTVAYAPPPAMSSTLVATPASGIITVTPVALAVVGTQPALINASLYRRPALYAVLNANPSMAGNITGWAYTGGGTPGTASYSTTQSHDAPGALRYVPPAVGVALPMVESATDVPLVATQLYIASAWIRPDTANKPITVAVNYYNAGGALQGTVTQPVANVVAGAWHYVEMVVSPDLYPAATKIRVAVGETSTPAAGDAFYADEIKLKVYDASTGTRLVADGSATAAYADWGVASGVDYEYRWVGRGANGTTINGPWSG